MQLISITAMVLLLASSDVNAETAAVGALAPNFARPLLDDERINLSLEDYRGQVVYLDFWASWCGPCLIAMPKIEALKQRFEGSDFSVLAINVDRDPKRARRFLNKVEVSYPSVYDATAELPKQYGLQAMPSSYVIDQRGYITLVHEGFRKGDEDLLGAHIQEVLNRVRE